MNELYGEVHVCFRLNDVNRITAGYAGTGFLIAKSGIGIFILLIKSIQYIETNLHANHSSLDK